MRFLRRDHSAAENQLQRQTFSDEPRQPLRPAAAGDEPKGYFVLTEFRAVHCDPDGARHRGLAAAAERKAIDGCNYRLAEALDEIEYLLAETTGLLCFERRDLCELTDIGAVDKALWPAPVRITPRTLTSSHASSKAVRKSFQVGVLSALSTLGLLTVT